MTVRAMTVCTSNICRSPCAHQPSSAGSTSFGRVFSRSRASARQISEQILRHADIVLPLEVEHRTVVLGYSLRHLKRTSRSRNSFGCSTRADEREPWTQRLASPTTVEERRGRSLAPRGGRAAVWVLQWRWRL